MTIDLWMLAASAGLTWLMILVAATPGLMANMKWGLGNRETPANEDGFNGRAKRAAENMKENLPLFATFVLVAHVSGSADGTSALGAEIFFGARALYAPVYWAGVPGLRTAVWAVSIVGMGLVAFSLVA
jgi:uncharacterized MAPEG superfamily protein